MLCRGQCGDGGTVPGYVAEIEQLIFVGIWFEQMI